MKKYIVIAIMIIVIIIFSFKKSLKLYSRDMFYMDTVINVKIYCDNETKAKSILDNIDSIYKEYHMLTDRYNDYGINNIYYINNNDDNVEKIKIDEKLYNMIDYADGFDTDLFDINLGGVIDVWKRYREKKTGIPTKEELKKANVRNEIKLLDNNMILNNHPNIDLGGISKGYTTQVVGDYLESEGIKYYLINAGGNVLAGDSYKKNFYKIGIQSPFKDGGISYILNSRNVSVVTSGGYERNYVYDGVMYHHIISPKTLFPTNYMESVTIVSSNSALGDFLSTTLFLMDVKDGMDFIKNYDAEAIWILSDGSLIKSEGFEHYEQK